MQRAGKIGARNRCRPSSKAVAFLAAQVHIPYLTPCLYSTQSCVDMTHVLQERP